MKTAKISLAFFSPTGSTKRVLERMGKRWTEDYEAVMQEINLTKLEMEQEKFLFGEQSTCSRFWQIAANFCNFFSS